MFSHTERDKSSEHSKPDKQLWVQLLSTKVSQAGTPWEENKGVGERT